MTTTVYEDQDRRAAEVFGLRPCTAAVCPRVAAGRRCLAYNADDTVCVCQRHHHVLDHARVWLDERGRHVFTAEPYSATGEDLADLITDMTELGLRVDLTGRSTWNPGYTLMIRIIQGAS